MSCKKDIINEYNNSTNFDTIKPLPYFPVYPNSFWKYLTINKHYSFDDVKQTYVVIKADSLIVFDTTAIKYNLHSYIKNWNCNGSMNCQQVNSDSVFVPFFNGEPIYQYSILCEIIDESVPIHYGKYRFFSEIVGDTFPTSYNYGYLMYTGLCLKVIDKYSTNGNDSIVALRGSYYGNSHQYESEKLLYKKNVGLILYEKYSPILKDTFYRKILIDYQIDSK